MREKKNIFVIQNGTQLLNANEYIYKEKLPFKDNILIVVSITDIVINDFEATISNSDFYSEVVYLFSLSMLKFNKTRLGRILSTIYAKKKLKKIIDNYVPIKIIIGNYQNVYCKLFIKYNSVDKVIIVDDGPSTIDIFNKKPKKLSKLNRLIEDILKITEYSISPDVIFTRFYHQIKNKSINNNIEIIENEFSYLKSNILKKKTTDKMFFVGYPMVEENIIDLKVYIDLLNDIKQSVGEFIYIPHRREHKDTLKAISQHHKIKNLGMPFELYLFKSYTYPSEIIGFFSTIFFNVHEMFGDKIKLKYVKLNHLKITHINDMEKLYQQISQIAEMIISYDIKMINN